MPGSPHATSRPTPATARLTFHQAASSIRQPPRSPNRFGIQPFPFPDRRLYLAVSRFTAAKRQPSSVSHRREFARRQRFCRAGKLQLEFLRKRKRDFFFIPYLHKRLNAQTSSPYNALIPIPQNSLNATFPNCPFPVPKLFWVSSQISSDLLYRSYGECVSGSVLLYGISFYRFL